MTFTPCITDAYGNFNTAGREALEEITRFAASRSGRDYSTHLRQLLQQLSVSLMLSNASTLLRNGDPSLVDDGRLPEDGRPGGECPVSPRDDGSDLSDVDASPVGFRPREADTEQLRREWIRASREGDFASVELIHVEVGRRMDMFGTHKVPRALNTLAVKITLQCKKDDETRTLSGLSIAAPLLLGRELDPYCRDFLAEPLYPSLTELPSESPPRLPILTESPKSQAPADSPPPTPALTESRPPPPASTESPPQRGALSVWYETAYATDYDQYDLLHTDATAGGEEDETTELN